MTAAIWLTPAGSLGIIPEDTYYELQLDAYNPAGGTLTFTLISGSLPSGLRLETQGFINGIPYNGEISGVPLAVERVTTSTFCVRITNADGFITDRTFELTIAGIDPPIPVPPSSQLATVIDGEFVSIQLDAIEGNPLVTTTFSLLSGELPPGLTLSSNGLIEGYVEPVPSDLPGDEAGYDATTFSVYPFDFSGVSVNKNFQFTVKIDDTVNTVIAIYTILYVI
jgi:hypothetical protein